jgi:hypothetical protein
MTTYEPVADDDLAKVEGGVFDGRLSSREYEVPSSGRARWFAILGTAALAAGALWAGLRRPAPASK